MLLFYTNTQGGAKKYVYLVLLNFDFYEKSL